ncbi:chloride channel protein [Flavobacterium sp. SUN046]|uniref:chloride channel protein n=1 Tax=Flavobacterium sp. SUN046 TaxID=3002440 RepID=UPI002DB6EF69|nr:chloride channel protein [Flavobacterium sp. SUN046]MEC4048282.1 chloride channel protein [Flavobacterium sp. SUN046]
MRNFTQIKKYYSFIVYQKLVVVAAVIGILTSFLALSLKHVTEYYEALFYSKAVAFNFYYFLFPFVGLTIIYVLRKNIFKNQENKGIKEIFEATQSTSKNLALYKIPSHFINGFFTVISGGATGIEVSTVVASATIGSVAQQKANFFKKYKEELICAGVAAGVTALFGSPIAGLLFSIEVISRSTNKSFWITNSISVGVASLIIVTLNEPLLFSVKIITWHYHALPYFILLGIVAGINSVYLTRSVLFIKSRFLKFTNQYHKILFTSLLLGSTLVLLPVLYGDGYHGIKEIIRYNQTHFSMSLLISILGILILKPIVTALTLASGGDGGVFAPSLVIGAFLGFFVASLCNYYFNAQVLQLNFIVIGMAAVLSSSIHAPFTALFLVCSIIGDYTLFLPLLLVCLISKFTAQYIFPYTVYSYKATTI